MLRFALVALTLTLAVTPVLAAHKGRSHHRHAIACPKGHGLNNWERCNSICEPYAIRRAYVLRRADPWDSRVRLDEFDIWDRCMTDRLGVDYFVRAPRESESAIRARY